MTLNLYVGEGMKKFINILLPFIIMFNTLFTPKVFAENLVSTAHSKDDYLIFIDVNSLTLSLIDKSTEEIVKTYPVALGKKTTPSPMGTWKITSKALKDGPFGGYWLGLNAPWDTFGIHGTSRPDSIGSYASNGCIRMFNHHIKELFFLVEYETSVVVSAGPSWLFSPYVRTIKPNDKGTDVYDVERILSSMGYFFDDIDGIYDYTLEKAVLEYREEHNLPIKNEIDREFLKSIGLYKFE